MKVIYKKKEKQMASSKEFLALTIFAVVISPDMLSMITSAL